MAILKKLQSQRIFSVKVISCIHGSTALSKTFLFYKYISPSKLKFPRIDFPSMFHETVSVHPISSVLCIFRINTFSIKNHYIKPLLTDLKLSFCNLENSIFGSMQQH